MRLSKALQGYWLDKTLIFSATTTPKYELCFRRFLALVGDIEVETLTPQDAKQFLAHVRDVYGLSRRSQSDQWVILSSLAAWLEKEGILPHFMRGRVPQPKAERRAIEPYSADEVKRLLAACERAADGATRSTALRDAAIVLTLLDGGLRVSELCALNIRDYDDGRGRLHVQLGKGSKARFVVIGMRARKVLWRYLATRPDAETGQPLFATRNSTHIDRHQLGALLRRVGQRAGVAHVHPHRFRHTCAVSLLRAGANALLVQEVLGHESLEMTRRYVRLADTDVASVAKFSPSDRL